MNTELEIDDIKLVQTCGACPEQYDAFIGKRQVGYLRLRHGYFRVEYPSCGGENIYEATPKGDGCFEYEERAYYLEAAKTAIFKKESTEPSTGSEEDVKVTKQEILEMHNGDTLAAMEEYASRCVLEYQKAQDNTAFDTIQSIDVITDYADFDANGNVTEWLDETESIPSEEEDELNKKATEWLKEWQKRRPGSAEYLTGCLEGYKEALKTIIHH